MKQRPTPWPAAAAMIWLAALTLAFGASAGAARAAEITLEPTQSLQVISGWEATASIWKDPGAPTPPSRPAVLAAAVNEVGINRLRLEIRSGAESRSGAGRRFIAGAIGYGQYKKLFYQAENDNADPQVIDWSGFDFSELDWHVETTVLPMRRLLRARGERLQVNLTFVSFRPGDSFQQRPEEYAEFVLATYLHLQSKYGFVPDYWEVILEPDMSPGAWDGRTIGRAVAAAARRLRKAGFRPAFIVPSVTNIDNAAPMIDQIARVPGAMEAVVAFSYHRYRGRPARALPQIADRAERYGKRTAMLEYWFGKATPEVLFEDLRLGRVSAWQGRALEGHLKVSNPGAANPLITPKDEVRYNRQVFLYVREGARRIGARSDSRAVEALAFVNRDGGHVVVALTRRPEQLTIRGLPAGRYRVSFAVAQGSMVRPERYEIGPGEALVTQMPGAGVITVSPEGRATP